MPNEKKDVGLKSGTGGTGSIGTTVPSGGQNSDSTHPDVCKLQNSNPEESMSTSYEEFIAQADDQTLALMIGGTGGVANTPTTVDEAKSKKVGPSEFLRELSAGAFRKHTIEEMTSKLLDTNNNFNPMLISAQKQIATIGVVIGTMANTLKTKVCSTMGGPKGWVKYRKQHIDPQIPVSTLKSYMDCADVNMVEEHLHIGLDRINKMAIIIKDNGLTHDANPIRVILANLDEDAALEVNPEKFKVNCDAAISRHRLGKMELDITFETLRNFHGCGLKIEKDDIAEMKHRKENDEDPAAYLVDLMDDPSNRQELMTHKPKPEVGADNAKGNNVPKVRVKDINSQVQRWRETVYDVLKLEGFKTPLEAERIDSLIEALQALRAKAKPKLEIAAETKAAA